MFVYWGTTNTGKRDVQEHCALNESPFSILYDNVITKCHNIKLIDVYDGGYKCEYDETEYAKNSGFRYEVVSKKHTHFISDEWRSLRWGAERTPQIDLDRLITIKDKGLIGQGRVYSGTYEAPFSFKSIGVDKTNIVIKHTSGIQHKIIKQLKQLDYVHIIPYRVIDNIDSLIMKIQMWDPKKYNNEFEDIFDCYNKRKDLVMTYLSDFYRKQRDTESLLQEYGVEYQFYDLDTYDLRSFTGLEKDFIHPDGPETYRLWNLDNPDTKKRCDMAIDICTEFLEITGLTDTRLEFRAKDGI
tara:strand:- start:22 stop:918 length:897 start_codon:yes stop_codon:yes gene_type:complete